MDIVLWGKYVKWIMASVCGLKLADVFFSQICYSISSFLIADTSIISAALRNNEMIAWEGENNGW